MSKLKRILVVEDTPELREDLTLELRDAGYDVIEAADGHTALRAVIADRPQLVICDIQLPDIDGFTILTAIRTGPGETKNVPFIVLSAFADTYIRNRLNDHEIDHFFVKPIDFDQLHRIVNEILSKLA